MAVASCHDRYGDLPDEFAVRAGVVFGALATAFESDGFVIVEAVLDSVPTERFRWRIDELAEAHVELDDVASSGRVRFGIAHDSGFDVCWSHSLLREAVGVALAGPIEVFGVKSREPSAGSGGQQRQPDVGIHPLRGIHSTWFIDAFTVSNGATRVVPGSHRDPSLVRDHRYGERTHPAERIMTGPPGSLLLRDVDLWHAGTTNVSGERRRSLQVVFTEKGSQ